AASSGSSATHTRAAGTPPYMAPELQSEAASPASDQFALATTAFELLFGTLPFPGRNIIERAAAALQGPPPPPADRRGVPRAVFEVLSRALAGTPSMRWPSIDGFAAALESAAGQRRRRAIAAAVVTAIGVGVTAMLRTDAPADPCPDPAPLLAAVWSPEHAATLAAGLEARRGPASTTFVQQSWSRVSQALDGFAQAWRASHRELCVATRVRHERSEQALDHGMACLAQQRARFETLIELVGSGDHETLQRAVESAAKLPDPRACEAAAPTADQERSPADDAAREAVARADQRVDLGDVDAGLAELEGIASSARERGDTVTLAMALTQRGLGLSDAERVDEAAAALVDGFVEAERAQSRQTAVDAAVGLAFVRSRQQGRHDDAQMWLRLAEANLPPSDARTRRAATLADAEGVLALDRGDDAAALRALDRTIELLEGDLDEGAACSMYDHRGTAALRLGRSDDAVADYDRARAACIAIFGPEHPRSVTPLANRAQVEMARGELDLARSHIAEAAAILRAAGAVDRLAMMEHNLGVLAAMQQDDDAAQAAFASALQTLRARRGPQHPDTLLPLVSLAQLADDRGAHDEAAAMWDEALAIARQLGPDHLAIVEPLMGKAENLRARGDATAALALDDEALRIAEQAGARELMASACIGAALGRRALGRAAEAQTLLQRAVELSGAIGNAGLEAEARELLATP
ncbi:MAG: tetratricopeptide repeat protein, partial [Nannocystaceae bacterium]|nr:tetratricopeptide repeat protein [Nannocystaceae bacterium]